MRCDDVTVETASLLSELCQEECKKSYAIEMTVALTDRQEQVDTE